MFTIPDDVRFHSYYRDIPADNFTWSTDWSKFVGIPGLLPGERLIYDNGHYMIRLTNAYWHYSIYISIVYVFIIFAIKSLMSRKETGFDLRYGLITWNLFLTLFSFIGTIRCLPEFFHVLYNNGFVASYTQNTYVDVSLNLLMFNYNSNEYKINYNLHLKGAQTKKYTSND